MTTTYDRMREAAEYMDCFANSSEVHERADQLRADAARIEACEREMRSKKAPPIYGTRESWADRIRGMDNAQAQATPAAVGGRSPGARG